MIFIIPLMEQNVDKEILSAPDHVLRCAHQVQNYLIRLISFLKVLNINF